MAVTMPAVTVPVRLQLGDGAPIALGDVTVALTTRTTPTTEGAVGVTLGLVNPRLVSGEVAALLYQAAATLRNEGTGAGLDVG